MGANERLSSRWLAAALAAALGMSAAAAWCEPGRVSSDHSPGGPPHSGGGPPAAGSFPPPPQPAPPPPPAPPEPPAAPTPATYRITFQGRSATPDAAGRAYLGMARADLEQLAAQNTRSRALIAVYNLGGGTFAPPGTPYYYSARVRVLGHSGVAARGWADRRLSRRRVEAVAKALPDRRDRWMDRLVVVGDEAGGSRTGDVTVAIDYKPLS